MSNSSSGLRIYPVTGSVSSGLFPGNDGAISPIPVTSLSNIAPGSVASVCSPLLLDPNLLVLEHAFFLLSSQFFSGSAIPARPPASIDMLQIIIRPSIERFLIEPAYSIICPLAPLRYD